MSKIQEITVKHAGGEYPVFVGAGAVRGFPTPSAVNGGIAIVTNETVWGIYEKKIRGIRKESQNPNAGDNEGFRMAGQFFEVISLPDGEEYKTQETVNRIHNDLFRLGMKRDGTVVALGGGVVGDIAGYAASVYMRGVDFVQVPTTLLAQVDAAIGGKTGINNEYGKNVIGTFYHPKKVICDINFLRDLPEKEYFAGLAEVVKYGLLGDADFFVWLEDNANALKSGDIETLEEAIVRSVKMKADIVAQDERETVKRDIFAEGGIGGRALLNLGHTFAHAAEKVAGYGELLHGEAVAAGLVAAAKLSEKERNFSSNDTARIIALLKKFDLPVSFCGLDPEDIRHAMYGDKKFTALDIRFVVMNSIGDAQLTEINNMHNVSAVLQEMCDN